MIMESMSKALMDELRREIVAHKHNAWEKKAMWTRRM